MTQPSLPRGAYLKKLGTSQGTITGPMGAQPDTRVKTVEAIGWHRLTEKEQQEVEDSLCENEPDDGQDLSDLFSCQRLGMTRELRGGRGRQQHSALL